MSDPEYPSLLAHFSPPDKYVGTFGWIIGFSADAAFLNEAAAIFTKESDPKRRHAGRVRLGVLLDAGAPQIPPERTPGVLHCLPKSRSLPWRLLHAKIALLGFRAEESDDWVVRLIVSTGNWTRQTLEESLDLAWVIEGTNTDKSGADVRQNWLDLRAAHTLLAFVRQHFAVRLPEDKKRQSDMAALERWLEAGPAPKRGTPRFFDSRTGSLLESLPGLIAAHAGEGARNHLSLGSGFFEGGERNVLPRVPLAIVNDLQENGLLTRTAKIYLIVDPDACQGIASAKQAIMNAGWKIIPSETHKIFGHHYRKQHSKFILGGNFRNNSARFLNPWVYIGSGNLTPAGFRNKMSPSSGNLEAGVIFAPETLCRHSEGAENCEGRAIGDCFPINWNGSVELSNLRSGAPAPERPEQPIAPPVPWLDWIAHDTGGVLRFPDDMSADDMVLADGLDVLGRDEQPIKRKGGDFHWPDAEPAQVQVQWPDDDGTLLTAFVPVRDPDGRIAGGPLPPLGVKEVIAILSAFPNLPDSDEEPDDQDDERDAGGRDKIGQSRRPTSDHPEAHLPIRTIMELVERIASSQTRCQLRDWDRWLDRLGSTLGQMSDTPALHAFTALDLDPLEPLRAAPFRPHFAEDGTTPEGQAYEAVLNSVARRWSRAAGMRETAK